MSRNPRKRKSSKSSFRLETFLLRYGLQIAGLLLIVGGFVYMLAGDFSFFRLGSILNYFSKSSSGEVLAPFSSVSDRGGYLALLFFVPGILLLALPLWPAIQKTWVKQLLVLAGYSVLALSEINLLMGIRSHTYALNYFLVFAAIGAVQLLATALAIFTKSRFALHGSILWLFGSFFMLRLVYGVIVPHVIFLMAFQGIVCWFCFRHQWRASFALLMTLSAFYISYYVVKLVLIAGFEGTVAARFMFPSLLVWFVLSIVGFGVLKPATGAKKAISFVWGLLPYFTLALVLTCCMRFYFTVPGNFLYLLYYALAVAFLVFITYYLRKKSFVQNGDPFYQVVFIFTAFLLPQLLGANFLLILSVSLAVSFLISVLFTDLKISFQFSMGFYAVTLGVYLAEWIFHLIPALLIQRQSGLNYPFALVLDSLILFVLSAFYFILFRDTLQDYSFTHSKVRRYNNVVGVVFYVILYLSGFLVFDFILTHVVPGYKANFMEWGFYSYVLLYVLILPRLHKPKAKQRYLPLLVFMAMLVYPVLIHPDVIYFRTLYLAGEAGALLPFVMHYACIGMLVLLMVKAGSDLKQHVAKNRYYVKAAIITGIVLLSFILLSEYDHLELLILNGLGNQSAYEILQYNRFIPYSILLLLVAVTLLFWSVFYYSRFLRRLAMVMLLLVLLKILVLDIRMISAENRIFLLITLGVALLVFSLVFSKIRNREEIPGSGNMQSSGRQPGEKEGNTTKKY